MAKQVLIIGRLGELAKKIIELEQQIETNSKDSVAILELASYNSILTSWPVENQDNATNLVLSLRITLAKLHAADQEMCRAILDDTPYLPHCVSDYIKMREQARTQIKLLNALGRFVGNVPLLNLPEQQENT